MAARRVQDIWFAAGPGVSRRLMGRGRLGWPHQVGTGKRLTVLFDELGYRELLTDLVLDQGVLRAVGA
jgi:hypothetical protein